MFAPALVRFRTIRTSISRTSSASWIPSPRPAVWSDVRRSNAGSRAGPRRPGSCSRSTTGSATTSTTCCRCCAAAGAFGLFYVPSAPVTDGVILDVHKIHLVLGRVGGPAALDRLTERHPRVSAADTGAGHYAGQVSDPATKRVKHLLNWRLDPEERRELIDDLVDFAFDGRPPRAADVYVDEQGIRRLAAAGMGVGAHGHEHVVLRGLKRARQELEIRRACDVIRSLAGTLCWGYCYAYGAFDATSESLVASAGFPFAFAASAGDIGTRFTETPRFALPRRNCNSFPHGIASVGGRRLSS